MFDNADEKIKWLPDLLARVVTGQNIPRQRLYTTNELVKYQVDCFLGITARTTPWARPDIISRLLLVKFKQPDHYFNEKKVKQDVIDNRYILLSHLIENASKIIRRLKDTEGIEYDSPSRLAGFYAFGMRTAENPEDFQRAFEKALGLQNALASEEEEIPSNDT